MIQDKYLKSLALAITDNPRGTTKELAEKAGISKATLHRLYGTRENVMCLLESQSTIFFNKVIKIVNVEYDDYKLGLHEVIEAHFSDNEFFLFSCNVSGDDISEWQDYINAMDNFFYRGQQNKDFTAYFTSQILTSVFISDICVMLEAERNGRIAPINISDAIETLFLYGANNLN